MGNVTKIKRCRVCGSKNLTLIFSLGEQYASDFVDSKSKPLKAPLELVQCPTCSLVQLRHTVKRDLLYKTYWYKSGTQEAMVKALQNIVDGTLKKYKGWKRVRPFWLDIGANDGTLLNCIHADWQKYGFEPAENLVIAAEKVAPDAYIWNDYFNTSWFERWTRKFNVISAIAMFYDLEDPNKFVSDVKSILAPDGVFVIQQNYLLTMLQNNTYENISHEHLEYYSLKSLEFLLARHGLAVFDVALNEVNGGSLRTYVCHAGAYPEGWRVHALREVEREKLNPKLISDFSFAIANSRMDLIHLLRKIKDSGKTCWGYGASNRGNTILQYLDEIIPVHVYITAFADRNPDKWGKYTVATNIPIRSEEYMRWAKPDYLLVLPYHFLDSFRAREVKLLASGTKMIIPLPRVRVVP